MDFTISENLKRIRYDVEEAKAKYRKPDDSVRIMAVTKTVPYERVNYAVSEGITLLGENRVQEYLSKKDFYDPETNIRIAASFLRWCLENSDYNLVRALAYYNAGWGNVTNENVGDLTLNYIQKITTYKKTFDDELELLELNY
jgi:hypothetical protein